MRQVASHILASMIAVAALGVAGCQLTNAGDLIEVELRTDKEFYIADTSTTIVLSVTNMSDDPVYFICTGQIYLEELDDGQVIGSWMVHGFEKCGGPTPIEANVTNVFDFRFADGSILGQLEEARFSENVRYRFRMDLFMDREFDHPLDDEDRTSDLFSIVEG